MNGSGEVVRDGLEGAAKGIHLGLLRDLVGCGRVDFDAMEMQLC